jgi:hypothetical protein
MPTALLLASALAIPAAFQAAPPDTEIFLVRLARDGGALTLSAPVNISSSPGYDNQPAFTPDGRAILFTSGRGGTAAEGRAPQTDIYRYDLAARSIARVTDTPESEYSPTPMPDGRHISVVRVEADGTQRLWRFTMDGKEPALVLAGVKPVGYHAWATAEALALFVLGQPATLHLADTRSGTSEILASGIGRSLQRTPAGTISFVQRGARAGDAEPPALTIMELDVATKTARPLVHAVAGAAEADLAWMPDGTLLMARGDVLYAWKRGDADWTRAADLSTLGITGATRLAVSPRGDALAIVAAAPRS